MGILSDVVAPAAGARADTFALRCAALPDPRALAFAGEEALGRCFDYDVYFTLGDEEAGAELALDDAIGASATLALGRATSERVTHVSGRVAAIEQIDDRAFPLYRLRLVPALWLLGLSSHHRVFVDKTIPDIVREVLALAGLGPETYAMRLTADYPVREHVFQYDESDLDFVQRCMEREGIFYYFDHAAEGSRLVITDALPDPAVLGARAAAYRPSAQGDEIHGGDVHALRASRTAVPREATVTDYNFLTPDVDVRGDVSVAAAGDDARRVLWGENETDPGGARRAARLEAERLEILAERYVAASRTMPAHAGFAFAIDAHPVAALNRRYLAIGVRRHGRRATPMQTHPALDVAHAGRLAREGHGVSVDAIAAGAPFRPTRATPRPRIAGLEIAVIDGPADSPYAQLDAHGRYLVRFLMDENDADDGRASARVRRLQPHGGAPEGWHLPLRKGTEVLVGFVGGDPDRPVIVGVAHNAHTPSVVDASNGTRNVLQTSARARLELEDREGQQYVDLSTPEQSTYVHFGAHAGLGDHNVVFGTQGDGLVNAGGNRDMVVGGDSSTIVQGDVTETYGATQTRTVAAVFAQTVTGHATETVTGGVAQTITGGLAQSITGGETRGITGALTETVTGPHELTIVGPSTETVGATYTQTVAAGTKVQTAATYTLRAQGDVALTTSGPMNMLASTWLMNAPGGQINVDSWLGHVASYFSQNYEQFYTNIQGAYLNMAAVNIEVGGARLDVLVGAKIEQNLIVFSAAGAKQHKAAASIVSFAAIVVGGFTAFI